jgi:hypothetical protein
MSNHNLKNQEDKVRKTFFIKIETHNILQKIKNGKGIGKGFLIDQAVELLVAKHKDLLK